MAVRLGDSRLVFGVEDEVWGYVQNIKEDESAEVSEAKNGAGADVAVEFFNVGKNKITGSFFYLSDQTGGPDGHIGDATGCAITNITGTIYINRAGKARASGAWVIVDFEGTYYPHLVLS